MFTVFFISYFLDNLQEDVNCPAEEFVKSHMKPGVSGNPLCVRVTTGEWVAWSPRVWSLEGLTSHSERMWSVHLSAP